MKNMEIYYSLLLMVFLLTTASAQQITELEIHADNMSATDLKELITESERNLESYRFTLAQDQNIEIVNLSEGNTTYRDLAIGSGAFNLTSKAMKAVTAILTYPVGQEENATAIATEEYLLNNTLYNKIDGNWTVVNLSLPGNVFTNQNRLNRSAERTNASEVRLLGTVIADGEGFYVVEVIPKSGEIPSLISEQLGAGFSIASTNLSALFNNTQLRDILWISINRHVPVAEYVQVNMTVTPELLGLPSKENVDIHIDSSTLLRFSGINTSVSIVLPEQAKRAEMLQLNNTRISSLNSTQRSPSGLALSQGVPSQDPVSSTDPVSYINSSSLTPEMQQQLWLAEAYRFLNGDYYTYGSPLYSYTYSSTYMPDYLSSYYPYYIPYYSPYYTPYYTPYTSSYQGYTPVTLGYTTPTQGYTAPAQGYTIMTASNSSTGVYLTDGRGITLYHLLSDQGRYTSNCTDATCTRIWPPFYAVGINVPANLNPADFSTITVNGYRQYQQIAYKGWPLYYFYRDARPGDIYGQGIRDSYGVWSVVSPESPNTFPVSYPYPSSGAAAAQYQYPTQQPSTITLSPSLPAYTTPSLYPPIPTPRPVTAPVSGSVPVTIRYPGAGPFDVYLDGNYIGTGSGGSFSFSAPAGYHDVRVWDGSFDYEQSVLFENGVSKIIYVEAV
jgi:predicted lipoprotein with Yx(FWY)xxD motif